MARTQPTFLQITCRVVFIVASVLIFGFWSLLGFFPIPKWIADYNVSRLSRQLYVGEPRSELVRTFGPGEAVSDPSLLRYSWGSVVAVCVTASEGFDVRLDAAGRVQSWQRNDDGSGC